MKVKPRCVITGVVLLHEYISMEESEYQEHSRFVICAQDAPGEQLSVGYIPYLLEIVAVACVAFHLVLC